MPSNLTCTSTSWTPARRPEWEHPVEVAEGGLVSRIRRLFVLQRHRPACRRRIPALKENARPRVTGTPGHAPTPCSETAVPAREAVIVGMGAFSPLGRQLRRDETGPARRPRLHRERHPLRRPPIHRGAGQQASATTSRWRWMRTRESWVDRATLLTVEAYREAIGHAGVNPRDLDPERVGVCLGSSHSGLVRTEEVARHVLRNQWERLRPGSSRRPWSRTAPRSSSACAGHEDG